MLDLLIAGGGPAGLVTALYAAAAGLDAAVVEPRAAPVDKACGEGLMPGTARALAELLGAHGCSHLLTGTPLRGISYLDGARPPGAAARRVDAPFPAGHGLGVRRTTLHAALGAAVAAAGVHVARARVTGFEQDGARVAARVRAAGWEELWQARYLVAADGLHSRLRRAAGLHRPDHRPPRWGLRQHYAVEPWSTFVEVHWAPSGEAYVTPVGPREVGVAVLTRGRGDLDTALDAFPSVRDRLGGADAVSAVRGAGPLRQRVRARRSGRLLLAGDAAGYVDALTGEGLGVAVRSARALVECVAAGRPEAYERRWRAQSRRSRLLTEALLLATATRAGRRAVVPAAHALPFAFRGAVAQLAR